MSEEQLRNLLRHAVPKAPQLDPAAIRRRAASERRNRVSVAVGGAAMLAIVAGTVGVAGLIGDDRGRPSLSDIATEPSSPSNNQDGPLAPYDVPPCPAQLPEGEAANRAMPDLDDVVAVRLCPDLNPRGTEVQPSSGQLAELDDADALVRNLDAFTAQMRRLPGGLPEYCADDESGYIRWSFAFYRSDGTLALVAAQGCQLVNVEGRRVDSEAVRQLYLAALDRQRDRFDYSRPFDHELTCASEQRGGPILPGRERLVAAVACDLPPGAESIPMDLKPVPLDTAQLAELNDAWAHPGDPIVRGARGEHECLDLIESRPFIWAATNRSDLVQLIDSPCGFLVWHGWVNHQGATIPTTLGKLGVR